MTSKSRASGDKASRYITSGQRMATSLWVSICVALALLLVPACTADEPGPGKHAMVVGHVDIPAGATAADADLRLRLKDPALGGRVLGETTIKGGASGRVPFVIRYDPRQITADHDYEVEAEVMGLAGSPLAAVVPIEVKPHDQPEVRFALRSAPQIPDDGDASAEGGVIVLPAQAPAVSQ